MSPNSGSTTPERPDGDESGPETARPGSEPAVSGAGEGWSPSLPVVVGAGVAVVLALVILVPLLSGGDGDGEDTSGTVPRPTTTLADCPAEAAEPPERWPLLLPTEVVITSFEASGNTYVATGITNDAERTLVRSMEETLSGFDFDEPEGEASDVIVDFASVDAEGSVIISDEDADACWDAVYTISFDGEPDASQLQAIGPPEEVASVEVDPEVASGLVDQVGGGSATTARGTFPLTATVCDLDPIAVEATSEEGTLAITGSTGGPVSLRWTYNDGVVVSDDAATTSIASATTALIIGNGSNDAGPETILAAIDCFG